MNYVPARDNQRFVGTQQILLLSLETTKGR